MYLELTSYGGQRTSIFTKPPNGTNVLLSELRCRVLRTLRGLTVLNPTSHIVRIGLVHNVVRIETTKSSSSTSMGRLQILRARAM